MCGLDDNPEKAIFGKKYHGLILDVN